MSAVATLLDRAVTVSAGLDLARVPAELVTRAGYVIADTVAVSRGGARQPELERLIELARADGMVGTREASSPGRPSLRSATVFSSPTCLSTPEYAAFLNATAGSFLEMDEGMRPTGHPAMQVVTAALGVAERVGASGPALLRAVLAGYETTSRLFRGFRLRYPVHPHGHFGAIGAAVAVALLEGADPVAAARIAATTPILSIWDACYEGATARNTWMGLAAQSGVRASMLARAGFTGSARALERAFGEVAGELVDEDVIRAALSYDELGIGGNYFKLHSACALSHAAIDAMYRLELPDPGSIQRIVVETVSNNLKLDRQPEPNDLSARFSLPYAVATVAVLGRSDPDAFSFRREVADLAARVEVRAVPDLEARWPGSSPARVTVHWSGGSATAEVLNPHGYHSEPITELELRSKFLELVHEPEVGDVWWRALTTLTSVESCAMLFQEGQPLRGEAS
ncbi:MAG: MmgE/PrpD family protein [Candidatus Limnocylindria bacterium]|nr:MmgE/PrpD family protein [Candidatus Limnocylindria bacterium]